MVLFGDPCLLQGTQISTPCTKREKTEEEGTDRCECFVEVARPVQVALLQLCQRSVVIEVEFAEATSDLDFALDTGLSISNVLLLHEIDYKFMTKNNLFFNFFFK